LKPSLATLKILVSKCLSQKIYKEVPESIWKNHFPQVGKEGTLKQMFDQEPLQIYAKSGSMSGVYNLSGFLYTKKEIYCYLVF
jgi:D-alanyl-D-alanine carboxypeptidase/D-alanyl-D-alanine-endopeptidase (penicillin-binding protein 4)